MIALLVGAVAGWAVRSSEVAAARKAAESARGEAEQMRKGAEAIRSESENLRAEAAAAAQLVEAEKRHSAELLRKEREAREQQLDEARTHMREANRRADERLADERRGFDERMKENDRRWELKFDALKKELSQLLAKQLADSGDTLRESNKSSLDTLLQPLKEQFEGFRKSVEDSRTHNEVSRKEIQEKFDSTMKLFAQQQDLAVRRLSEETAKIGNDAVALANALKTNSKKQGNWGELVLETMLENSGLKENEQYFRQPNYKDKKGNDFRPDVVIRFSEGRNLIVDSKVSLTAYAESFETDDEERRSELLLAHLDSVNRHIDELSRKNYPSIVPDSLDYVLMFIPNESSYIAAIKLDPGLLRKAADKNVIVISPNNLIMALQLAYNLWKTDAQIKNLDKIVERGKLLYEKISTFQSTFTDLGKRITALQSVYDEANAQAFTGRGNLVRQCQMLEEYGVKVDPKKRIKPSEEDGDMPQLEA